MDVIVKVRNDISENNAGWLTYNILDIILCRISLATISVFIYTISTFI